MSYFHLNKFEKCPVLVCYIQAVQKVQTKFRAQKQLSAVGLHDKWCGDALFQTESVYK